MMESQQHSDSLSRGEEGSSDSILYEKCVHAAFRDDPEQVWNLPSDACPCIHRPESVSLHAMQLSAQHDAATRKSGKPLPSRILCRPIACGGPDKRLCKASALLNKKSHS